MELMPFMKLLEKNKVAKIDKSLFMYSLPGAAQNGILLREELTGTVIDYELPGYYRTSFQIVVRDIEYDSAKVKMKQVIDNLTLVEVPLDMMWIKFCRPRTTPGAYQQTPGSQVEFSVYMDLCFCEAP